MAGFAVAGALPDNAQAVELVAKISERKVYVYSDRGELVKKFDIAVARPGKVTPMGTFYVSEKLEWPDWYRPQGGVIPGGPGNPLGERWIGYNGEYGFHGTNDQSSVGKEASSGCFRMKTQDILSLYNLVKVGDKVTVTL
jgi:lipoprotein-anchoring transpeptidase ErfK/SrfK